MIVDPEVDRPEVDSGVGVPFPANLETFHRRFPCNTNRTSTNPPFERSSKRRKGFPSETHVKRGLRIVHGDKELTEKLGREDPCPCGSGRRFQKVLHADRSV
jgi:SEC-C motif